MIATYIQLYCRHSHYSRETFARVSQCSREIFLRASHDCETFARVSHDCREIFVRASHDSRETFVRVSHDVRANFNQFYFSQLSLEMVLILCRIFVELCRSRKLPCDVFANVFEGLATGSRQVRDICDDLATVLR